MGDELKLYVEIEIEKSLETPEFFITISDKEQRPVALLKPNESSVNFNRKDNTIAFTIKHSKLQLSKGIYTISFTALTMERKAPLLRINNVLTFQMLYEREIWPPFLLDAIYEQKNRYKL